MDSLALRAAIATKVNTIKAIFGATPDVRMLVGAVKKKI